jgi:hypothetical protein
MSSKALVSVVFSTMTVFAGERLNISVSNQGGVPGMTVARAENVVAAVFGALEIEVSWCECEGSEPGIRIFLRLRRERPADGTRSDSVEVMGRAFAGAGIAGNMADAYYGANRTIRTKPPSRPGRGAGLRGGSRTGTSAAGSRPFRRQHHVRCLERQNAGSRAQALAHFQRVTARCYSSRIAGKGVAHGNDVDHCML